MEKNMIAIFPIIKRSCLAAFLTLNSLPLAALPGDDMTPPKYTTGDKFQVDVTGQQAAPTIETVAIGGQYGLSHSIQFYSRSFYLLGNDLYFDKYAGSVRRVAIGWDVWVDGVHHYEPQSKFAFNIIQVSAMGDSHDFKVMKNGTAQKSAEYRNDTATYFESMGDARHTLDIDRGLSRLTWTKPDGTAVEFSTGGYFIKIVFPNGYTIERSPYDIKNNTGYQLKFDYVQNAHESRWSADHPKKIIAFNSAVDYCHPSSRYERCHFSENWPSANVSWPYRAPESFYTSPTDKIVTVENAKGGVTKLRFARHDIALLDPHDVNSPVRATTTGRNEKFEPRLVGITLPGASEESVNYRYQNDFIRMHSNGPIDYVVGDRRGHLIKASGINGVSGYSALPTRQGSNPPMQLLGNQIKVIQGESFGTLKSVSIKGERDLEFEEAEGNSPHQYRNFVTSVRDSRGVHSTYHYDSRNNLEKIIFAPHTDAPVVVKQKFPTTCDNRKTCNKPVWKEDGRGMRTRFTYHPQSGQLATVTSPADQNGKIAQTRFFYSHLHAYKRNASGNKVVAGSKIWMKTREAFCRSSNYVGGACEVNGDEVVTRYEYNSDNLNLTAVVVTADGESLRTCYEYDIYGNQIGETSPNANLASCPRS